MPFISKESFRETDDWLSSNDPADPDNFNDEIFGAGPAPYSLVDLKADPESGDAGTGKPANGAAANDPAFAAGDFVILGDESYASWDGTEWVQFIA